MPGRMSEDRRPRGGGGARGARRAWLCWWVLLTALYVALTDTRRPQELGAAVVIGALGAVAATLVRARREVVLRPRPRDLLAIWDGVRRWPRDLVLLIRALAAREPGRVVEVPFAATGEDPRSAARRALAVAGGSLAPNSIVIEIDAERGVLVRHELVDDGG
jgi:hypothetical protein